MSATALLYDARVLAHDNGSMLLDETAAGWLRVLHAENPERVERAAHVLEASGVADRLERPPVPEAAEAELTLVHDAEHVRAVRQACDERQLVWVGPEARANAGSWTPALLSAGAALAAVDWACARKGGRAYALSRPPGHHASAAQSMGFCLFNNVALAARRAQREHGAARIAIVDWDVHHGNGTQAVFYDDRDVLFVSLHQDGLYPADLGTLAERGAGAGEGANVNVPLPAGSGDAGYRAAMDEVVVPALRRFDPDLILLSSGQDAAASDPLGRMSVTAEGFRALTRTLVLAAEELCEGRIVAVQEGGYSIDHMPFCVLATVEALAGLPPALPGDPMELDLPTALGPAERAAVDAARDAHGGT